MASPFVFEKRLFTSKKIMVLVPFLSILGALFVGGIFLALTGFDPFQVYQTMLQGAFGSKYGFTESIAKAIPLLLCGLGVAIAFKMKLWNIGAEGQFYMGAFAATGVALNFSEWPSYLLIPAMLAAGMVGGGLWALLPAIPRAYWKVNETIMTLMLNYVAILWVEYLIFGPWKDPAGFNFPLTPLFVEAATLPLLGDSRVHAGLIFALGVMVLYYLVFKYSKWGFEVAVIGENPKVARYAGMNIPRNILIAMALSGALAGLAGMAEVSGITHRLQQGISPGYGYTAIIIAWLGRLNPFAMALVSVLFGGLLVGGFSVQTMMSMPAVTVSMLQGLILFFVLGGEIFTKYRLVRARGKGNS